jgi:hypothetical protein
VKALVFGVAGQPFDVPDGANWLTKNLANSPVGLRDVPDPVPLHDDWVITRPRLTRPTWRAVISPGPDAGWTMPSPGRQVGLWRGR